MTEEEVREYLSSNGYPDYIVRGGSAGLVTRWKKFVNEVERGYRAGLEDYRNDLDIRAILRMVALDSEVHDADERFKELLIGCDVRVWESIDGDPWWDFGYPSNAPSLEEGLREEGML